MRHPSLPRLARLLSTAAFAAAAVWAVTVRAQTPASPFAALVARLSERGGDFGADNLISNEQSYLRVLPALEAAQVSGGAYVGVGPDQNFSYIAAIKPSVAFIIDIRRDNLLLHLLFKAIFSVAPTRADYVSVLTDRPVPAPEAAWRDASIEKIVGYVDGTPAAALAAQQQLRARLDAAMTGTGVPLSPADLDRIDMFHREFVSAGLSLVFQVRGQSVRSYYPTLRALLEETDGAGHERSFLASEAAYQFVRSLEARNLVIPVVGDVTGPKAMRAIAADMTARGTPLSAIYISNVEQYLFQDGTFPAWVANLTQLPHNDRSTIIRSVFPSGFRGILPQSVPGMYSTSLLQSVNAMLRAFAAGKYRSYYDLVGGQTPFPRIGPEKCQRSGR